MGLGAHVVVCEVDPIRALEARMEGLEVLPALQAAERGDADAADGSQWKAGIHLDVRAAGYALLDLSEGIASEQQAMAALGIDVKAGQRARLESRDRLRAVVDGLKALVAAAEEADRDDDPRAAVEWYRQWFEMAAPSAAQFTGEAVHA